jgi:AhpD family alkylhydroperoxidase
LSPKKSGPEKFFIGAQNKSKSVSPSYNLFPRILTSADFHFSYSLEEHMHYHDSDDLKHLGEFSKLAPTEFKAFVEFDKIVGRDGGAIPKKYRELIAIAVACTTQCPYCLDVHTRAAKRAGATREEVTETAMLAAALRAGAAVTHGALAVKLFDQA